jgi:hypothetical protein
MAAGINEIRPVHAYFLVNHPLGNTVRYPRLTILGIGLLVAFAWDAWIVGPKPPQQWSVGRDILTTVELSQDQRDRICAAGIEHVKAKVPGAKIERCKGHRNITEGGRGAAIAVVVLASKNSKDPPMYNVDLDDEGPQWRALKLEKVN